MIKNFDIAVKNIRGKDMFHPADKDGKSELFTLADIAIVALSTKLKNDDTLEPKKRNNLISLAIRIGEGGDKEYTTQELGTILERTEQLGENLWNYRMIEFIEGKVDGSDVQ